MRIDKIEKGSKHWSVEIKIEIQWEFKKISNGIKSKKIYGRQIWNVVWHNIWANKLLRNCKKKLFIKQSEKLFFKIS